MITPDDPRHGTTAGYQQGCRDRCCSEAKLRYNKRRNHARRHGWTAPPSMPMIGYRRRIRALQALGYTIDQIAAELGCAPATIGEKLYRNSDRVSAASHARLVAVYDRLSMVIPKGPRVAWCRANAAIKGWPTPLAWNEGDLDNPDAEPHGAGWRPRQKAAAA